MPLLRHRWDHAGATDVQRDRVEMEESANRDVVNHATRNGCCTSGEGAQPPTISALFRAGFEPGALGYGEQPHGVQDQAGSRPGRAQRGEDGPGDARYRFVRFNLKLGCFRRSS